MFLARRGTLSAEPEREQSEDHAAFADTAVGEGAGEGEWPATRPEPRIVQETGDLEPEEVDPMIGRMLGGLYRVESRIGEGGMGAVYMAVHIHLNKGFAVKVLSEKVAANKTAVSRMLQEAQAACSIEHDNIVDVINFDETDDGRVYLVMELLKGTSLATLVDAGPMKLERALPIAYQICEALQAAHESGIVHRDLKPENVFIVRKSDADFVKVLDFGISKVKTAEAEEVRMTKTGQLVGTPLYMSPEQAKGETDIDHRSDIYSLGVMLYEMLVGEPPFEGGNYFQLLWKHGNEPPTPPREKRPEIPEGVEAAILKCLEKERDARFQSMAELESALAAAAPGIGMHPTRLVSMPPRRFSIPQDPEPELPPARSGRGLAALAVVGILVGAVGIGVALNRDDPPPAAETPPPEPAETEPEPTTEVAPPVMEALPMGAEVPPEPRASVPFDSSPAGAEVLVGGEVVCVTPCEHTFDEGAELDVEMRLGGRRARFRVDVERDMETVHRNLRPRRSGSMDNGAGPMFKLMY